MFYNSIKILFISSKKYLSFMYYIIQFLINLVLYFKLLYILVLYSISNNFNTNSFLIEKNYLIL